MIGSLQIIDSLLLLVFNVTLGQQDGVVPMQTVMLKGLRLGQRLESRSVRPSSSSFFLLSSCCAAFPPPFLPRDSQRPVVIVGRRTMPRTRGCPPVIVVGCRAATTTQPLLPFFLPRHYV